MDGKITTSITLNILLHKEGDLYIGHCLELDIITAGTDSDQVKSDLIDLITAQIYYAFSNDNLDNLFRPAPKDVWEEFYKCHDCKRRTPNLEKPKCQDE